MTPPESYVLAYAKVFFQPRLIVGVLEDLLRGNWTDPLLYVKTRSALNTYTYQFCELFCGHRHNNALKIAHILQRDLITDFTFVHQLLINPAIHNNVTEQRQLLYHILELSHKLIYISESVRTWEIKLRVREPCFQV